MFGRLHDHHATHPRVKTKLIVMYNFLFIKFGVFWPHSAVEDILFLYITCSTQ